MTIITLKSIVERCADDIPTLDELRYLLAAQDEIERLRAANVHTLVACSKCNHGVRARNAVHGLCCQCARIEVERLRHAVDSWLVEEEDWKTEEARLRKIEVAIRECPTATLPEGKIKTLVYTTELRDALGSEEMSQIMLAECLQAAEADVKYLWAEVRHLRERLAESCQDVEAQIEGNKDKEREIERLRGIEEAMRGYDDKTSVETIADSYRHLAEQMREMDGLITWPQILDGIADALEIKS